MRYGLQAVAQFFRQYPMFHPASLLVSWAAFALILQWVPLPYLLALATASLLLAAILAPVRSRNLLWRSRWLLLSLGILFLFFTPGEYLPGIAGRLRMSYEGLSLAGEHLGRLLAMLASLAVLHEGIGTAGLLAGLYWLLRPFSWREVTVVRLMLVLEYVEQRQKIGWREWLASGGSMEGFAENRTSLGLAVPSLRTRDRVLIGGLLVAGAALVASS